MNWVNLLTLSSVLQGPGSQAAGTPTVAATPAATTAATTAATAAATVATTATATLTGGAAPTITSVVVTPPPIATAVAAPPAANPLSGDFLTSVANPPLGPFSIGFLLLGLILLGAGIYFFFVEKARWQRSNPLRYRATNTWSLFALILGLVSVLFVLLRVLGVPGLNIH